MTSDPMLRRDAGAAAERTGLAWDRTALSLAVALLVLVRLLAPVSMVATGALIVLGALVFLGVIQALRRRQRSGYRDARLVLQVAALCSLIAAAELIRLVEQLLD